MNSPMPHLHAEAPILCGQPAGSRPGPMVPPEIGPAARNEARGAGARRGVRAARRAVPLVAFVLAGAGLAPRAGPAGPALAEQAWHRHGEREFGPLRPLLPGQ